MFVKLLKIRVSDLTAPTLTYCVIDMNDSFAHPPLVSNLYEFLSSVEHKRRYFKECFVTKQLPVVIQFFVILWKSMATVNCLVTSILENIIFSPLYRSKK